ncbi:hypothetical protein VUR80DRAFT_925 [Thermomyces stellatus]
MSKRSWLGTCDGRSPSGRKRRGERDGVRSRTAHEGEQERGRKPTNKTRGLSDRGAWCWLASGSHPSDPLGDRQAEIAGVRSSNSLPEISAGLSTRIGPAVPSLTFPVSPDFLGCAALPDWFDRPWTLELGMRLRLLAPSGHSVFRLADCLHIGFCSRVLFLSDGAVPAH